MKSVSLRMKGGMYFFPDSSYYYNFKEQLQMKNDIILADPRRQIET